MSNNEIPTSITLEQVLNIYHSLGSAKSQTKSVKHAFSLIAMRVRLKPIFDSVEELNKEPESVTNFNKERTRLCSEYSLKDLAGDPILYSKPGTGHGVMSYSIDPERSEEFKEKIKTLTKLNEVHIKAWTDKIEELKKLMNEPSTELKDGMLSLINISWFKPEVDSQDLENLFPILVDDSNDSK